MRIESLSTCATPLIENGHDATPGTDASPVTRYVTSSPFICPDAAPDTRTFPRQMAENSPESELPLWPVTRHSKFVQEFPDTDPEGDDFQLPMSNGIAAAAVSLGPTECLSKPAQPAVTNGSPKAAAPSNRTSR